VGIPDFWQQALVGALILGAIVLDRVLATRRARRLVEARDEEPGEPVPTAGATA